LTWEEVVYGENYPLKAPIVAVTNTEETKGAHWIALVILPEEDDWLTLLFVDSYYKNKEIPEVLKTVVLKEGIDEYLPLSKKIRFLQSSDFEVKQLTDGNSCGYWAIYNVLCCTQTKNLHYLLKFSKEGNKVKSIFSLEGFSKEINVSLLLEDLEEKDENNEDDKGDHKDDGKDDNKDPNKEDGQENPAEGDGDINQEVAKAAGNEGTEEDEEVVKSIGGEEAGDQIIVAGNQRWQPWKKT